MPEKIIIGISVENKIASVADKNAVIVCGNSNYKAVFAFDSEWENYKVKTALFATENGDNGTIAVVFEGNECDIPPLENTTIVGVGVASGDITQGEAVELATTTPAYIDCLLSIKDLGGVIAPPAPDVYDQIIALLNKYLGQGGGGSGETGGGLTEAEVKEIVQAETQGLQPKVDDGLETESKSVVGAINELKGENEDIVTELAVINTVLEQSGLVSKYKATIEDTYNERVTADGANVLDGSKAKLEKVVGNTVKYDADENGLNGKLANASFGGIESTNADGTETSTLDFPKTETPLGVTIDFENKKITDYGVDLVLTGTETVLFYPRAIGGVSTNGVRFQYALNYAENVANAVCTDATINKTISAKGMVVGTSNRDLYWVGILDTLNYTTEGKTPTEEEKATAIANFKAYLAQRYADGNPVKIRYVSSTLQSETDFTAEQSASGNEYTAYKGGTESVKGNDNADYGADNTLSQNYIIVTGVK